VGVRVLIADDSDVVREAIVKVLKEEPSIEVLGEAATFNQAVQMITDFKPEVILLDLHMATKRDFKPDLVKSRLSSVERVLAVSFSNDAEALALAQSYGAEVLLDKMKLYDQLVPTLLRRHVIPASPERAESSAAD
jgi:two-component system invasion response regulator UvrY